MNCLLHPSTLLLLILLGRSDSDSAAHAHGDHGNGDEEAANHHNLRRHIPPVEQDVDVSVNYNDGDGYNDNYNDNDNGYTEHILMHHDHVNHVVHDRIDPPHDAHAGNHIHDDYHDHHHTHADVFESCLVLCYRDMAAKYGIEFADQLKGDGFVFFEDCPEDEAEYSPSDNNNVDVDGSISNPNIQYGITSSTFRQWNIPEFRSSNGKLEIPYSIMTTSYFNQETLDTIQLALSTIESSSGVMSFTPRTTQSNYIYFQYHSSIGCAAIVGRATPTNVYLGWCRYERHLSSIIHEILHALGFWHEQSRPDRDEHVHILTGNIIQGRENNFGKMTAVDSLGSPYDYNSIMHYPSWAFSKSSPDPTIVPLRTLEKWEIMGQRVKMSPSDIRQLRLLYQCSNGSRNGNTLTMDNLCSVECKCWEYAMGTCDDNDECMGDLECGPTPVELPMGEEYLDQLPPFLGTTGPIYCSTHCHSLCCAIERNILLCPETCDTAPPYVEPSEIPERMCLPPGLTERPSGSPSGTVMPTEGPSESITPTMTRSPTESPTENPTSEFNSKWYIKWSISKCVQNCVGNPPCGDIGEYVTFHDSMEACCDGHLGWMRTYVGCSTMPDGTEKPTHKPSKAPSVSPTTAGPSSSPTKTPTDQPTTSPSKAPSVSPTTASPSSSPIQAPTDHPTAPPSKAPSASPTTASPSSSPTDNPTAQPTTPPSTSPSVSPTTASPSSSPTDNPTAQPITPPSTSPSASPTTASPSSSPTDNPTAQPTTSPSKAPSVSPTTADPTTSPSKAPSVSPTTADPTTSPSKAPTGMPTTASPSGTPSKRPTDPPFTPLWYVDWSLDGGKCVGDCEGGQPCGGKMETWEKSFDTVDSCCGSMPWMAFKDCSNERPTTTTTTATTTTTGSTTVTTTTTTTPGQSKWYPGSSACTFGIAPTWQQNKYSSRSTCCTNHFNWNYNKCMDIKPTPSYKWYVHWGVGKCVQDCEKAEGGSCGGLVEGNWVILHATGETCCGMHMSSVLLSKCKYMG